MSLLQKTLKVIEKNQFKDTEANYRSIEKIQYIGEKNVYVQLHQQLKKIKTIYDFQPANWETQKIYLVMVRWQGR